MYMADQERLTRYMTHVIDSFPSERENIEQRTRDVQEKWEMLENKARERLEDAVGMQLFTSWFKILQQ
jgi:spectrin beta